MFRIVPKLSEVSFSPTIATKSIKQQKFNWVNLKIKLAFFNDSWISIPSSNRKELPQAVEKE